MSEELNVQLTAITAQLTQLVQKQNEQDEILRYLGQKVEVQPPPPKEEIKVNQPVVDLFRIPDPIKSIPTFDGNKKQVTAWLKTAEETLRMFEPLVQPEQLKMYWRAVKNKIEGKARDIVCLAGDPESFTEVKQILLDTLGDKQELSYYKSQLWANKQTETTSIHNFYNKTKEIVQNIKTLAKQKEIYNNSWQAICTFIDEDALAAFLSGLRKPYFGYAQAARPKDIEEAYAFLCKFNSNEIISNNSRKQYVNQTKPNIPNAFEKPKIFNSVANSKQNHWKQKDLPTPMEVDPSLRTKQTYNKKLIYNHELCSNEENTESSEKSEEPTSEEINFQKDQESDTED